jgi:hypothetical protein
LLLVFYIRDGNDSCRWVSKSWRIYLFFCLSLVAAVFFSGDAFLSRNKQ